MTNTTHNAIVLTPCASGDDGISEVSRQFAKALTDDGWCVDLWALDGDEPSSERVGPVAFRSARGSRARLAAWSVSRARRSADDLLVAALHVHLAPLGIPLALRGARLACFFHGIEVWRPLRARERKAVELTDVLIANSQYTVDRFRSANPDHTSRPITVCHLSPPPAVAPELPDRSGYALVVGRMAAEERYKGHEQLIDAWRDVQRHVPGAQLVVVGEGDDRGRLEALARSRGLDTYVHFVGRVSAAALAGYYERAAFFVMPSRGEGFGLVYLEAMRAGKPCIAAPGAAEEIIEHGVSGLVVEPTSSTLVEAIVDLFHHPDRCSTLGRGALMRVETQFHPSQFASSIRSALATSVVPA